MKEYIALLFVSSSLNAITLTALLNLSFMKNTVNAIAINKTKAFIILCLILCGVPLRHTTYYFNRHPYANYKDSHQQQLSHLTWW